MLASMEETILQLQQDLGVYKACAAQRGELLMELQAKLKDHADYIEVLEWVIEEHNKAEQQGCGSCGGGADG